MGKKGLKYLDVAYGVDAAYKERIENMSKSLKDFDKYLKNSSFGGKHIISDMFDNIGYEDNLKAVKHFLIGMGCSICGVSPKEFIGKKSMKIKHNFIPFTSEFKSISAIWKDDRCVDTDSILFKCRFISCLLSYYVVALGDIVESYVNSDIKVGENRALDLCSANLIDLITKMICSESFTDEMGNLSYQVFAINGSHDSARSYIKKNKKVVKWINGKKDLKNKEGYKALIKNAFAITTGARGVIKPKTDISGRDPSDISSDDREGMIRMLGAALIAYREKHDMSPLYLSWSESRPLIKTRFNNIMNDPELNQGVRALKFWSYMTGNATVIKFISRFIK